MNRAIQLADYFGMMVTILCLMHCLGIPLLLILLPLTSLGQPDDAIHRFMAVMVTLPVLLALIPGFVAHRRRSVLVLGGLGLTCFIVAILFLGPRHGETAEVVLASIGGAFLLAAHFRNRSFCRRCQVHIATGQCLDKRCN